MERVRRWVGANGAGNIMAVLMFLVSPLRWTSPFGAAYLTAAGYGKVKWQKVLPGAAIGAFLGNGGFGGFAGGLIGYTLAGIFHARGCFHPKSALSLGAFFSCLIPALAYHLPCSAYDSVTAVFASFISMAACPVLSPVLTDGAQRRLQRAKEESVALLLMCAVCVAALTELVLPLGTFTAGLIALVFASGGIGTALFGALAASAGLVIGSAEPSLAALLIFCQAAAAGMSRKGPWAQAGMFLIGIPLSAYFGFDMGSAFMLAAAAVYPWIPRGLTAQWLRYAGFFDENSHTFLTAGVFRRHVAPNGQEVCGDAGFAEKLPGGRMLFVLSDGMGTGRKARFMSERALGYVKSVFCAPLANDDKIKCVNALTLQEAEQHATLDICLIDLITGKADFIKNGAEPCWVIGKNSVRRLEGGALPVGIVENAPPAKKQTYLMPGDTVFMATDGLIFALGGADNAEKLLLKNRLLSPSALCGGMIKAAQSAAPERRRDDMSVMCIRIGGRCAHPRAVIHLSKNNGAQEKKAG